MIYLDPPYQTINGYTVLADHADPNQYYVLPSAPSLALGIDDQPAFSLIQFLGGGAGASKISGGMLTLTTELHVPDSVLSDLASRVAQRNGRSAGEIRLTSVLFESGSVQLVALGASSPTPADGKSGVDGGDSSPMAGPRAAGGPSTVVDSSGPFQVRFLGSGRASLGGNNQAVFQLVLDASAAELVEAALEAPDLPMIAVYTMAFAGLRPSFRVDVKADWSQVYKSLQNKANINVYYVAADVDAKITEALQENHIEIDTSVFGTSESERSAAERARKQLMDWVLDHFFTPVIDATSATANSIGQTIEDTAWSLVRSLLPGVGYKLRLLEEDQIKFLSARMSESIAERREVIPQGTLGGMIYHYRIDEHGNQRPDWPSLKEKLVSKVNLDGFPRLEVQVACEDRFASDGLLEVQVDLARLEQGSRVDPESLVFRSAAERENYIVNLLGKEIDFASPYQYRSSILFDPASTYGPHAQVGIDWKTAALTELYVEPRDAYMIRTVTVDAAPTFSFIQFPAVTVELRYPVGGDATSRIGRLRLTQDNGPCLWSYRSFSTSPQPYEARITYHRTDEAGGDLVIPWQPMIEDWLSVPDPMPVKRTLNIFISLFWQDISIGFLEVAYNDEAHGVKFNEQIPLGAATNYIFRDYPIAAGGPQTLRYRLTLLFTSGLLLEGSWRETDDDRLLLDHHLVDTRQVTLQAIGGTLDANHLSAVQVMLEARDPDSGQARASQQFNLQAGLEGQPFTWEYLAGDPPIKHVHYSAAFIDTNGFVINTPWTAASSDLLVLQLKTKTITG